MAIKYVDLGITGTGHEGDEDDPFSLADFVGDSHSGHTYKCKGWGSLTAAFASTDSFVMEAWDIKTYGPWRIYGGSTYAWASKNADLSDGIIEADTVTVGSRDGGTTQDMYFRGHSDGIGGIYLGNSNGAEMERCTFSSVDSMIVPADKSVSIDRGLFLLDTPGSESILVDVGASCIMTNCATTSEDESAFIGGTGTYTVDARYNQVYFQPWTNWTWADVYLKNYNQTPGFGVGSSGSWAEKLFAMFSTSVRSGVAPVTVQFMDESTGYPASWLWDFGDGETSTDQSPTHTYDEVDDATQYTVTLTVTNDEDGEAPSWVNDDYYYFDDGFEDGAVDTWINPDLQDDATVVTRDGENVLVMTTTDSGVSLFPEDVTLGDETEAEFWWRINFGDMSGPNHSIKLEFYDSLSGTGYFEVWYIDTNELVFKHNVDGGHGVSSFNDASPSAPSTNGHLDIKLVISGAVAHLYWSEDDGDTWTLFDDGGDEREYDLTAAGMGSIAVKSEGATEYGFEFFRFQSDDDPDESVGFPKRFVSNVDTATSYIQISPSYAFPVRGYGYQSGKVAYHYGMPKNPEQGYGWSEIQDGAWVWPDSPASLVSFNDIDGYRLAIGNCSKDGLFWLLNTRKGPSSSTLVKRYLDKIDPNDSSSGTEIPSVIKWPKRYGSKEHFVMQHMETHLHINPEDEDNAGADGYTSSGMRSDQAFTFKIYKDNKNSESARALTIPEGREVMFTRHVRGSPLQLELITVTSEFKVGKIESYFTVYDKAKFPAKNSRDDSLASTNHDDTLSRVIFWVARGEDMGRDRRTRRVVGQVDSKVTGPDSKTKSGAVFES